MPGRAVAALLQHSAAHRASRGAKPHKTATREGSAPGRKSSQWCCKRDSAEQLASNSCAEPTSRGLHPWPWQICQRSWAATRLCCLGQWVTSTWSTGTPELLPRIIQAPCPRPLRLPSLPWAQCAFPTAGNSDWSGVVQRHLTIQPGHLNSSTGLNPALVPPLPSWSTPPWPSRWAVSQRPWCRCVRWWCPHFCHGLVGAARP